jgi:hypothetical protein
LRLWFFPRPSAAIPVFRVAGFDAGDTVLGVGLFSWWPVALLFAGRPADLGFLCLLPVLLIITWIVWRLLALPRRRWSWGKVAITAPLVGLTLLALVSLEAALTWRSVTQAVALGLFWLVFLFAANEDPTLTLPIALVILIQATIGIGQFLSQTDLVGGAASRL